MSSSRYSHGTIRTQLSGDVLIGRRVFLGDFQVLSLGIQTTGEFRFNNSALYRERPVFVVVVFGWVFFFFLLLFYFIHESASEGENE